MTTMQVEPPTPFAFPSSFEDFFNMDLVSTQSAAASSPASSPRSPLPQTPPQPPPNSAFATYDPAMGMGFDSAGFSTGELNMGMFLDDELAFAKLPAAASPYDFLGAFNALADTASSSSAGGSVHTMSPQDSFLHTDSPQFAIDPALVDAASPEHADDEDEHSEPEPAPAPEKIAPVKVGGKGKARKGTVAGGGIRKAAIPEKEREKDWELLTRAPGEAKVEDRESDDWRPSPEEYKKMSSKEKRQLRNKISARNFRVRRKEYISTLEADISERDALISAIRSELGSSQSENMALRQEIDALKKNILSNRAPSSPTTTSPTTAAPTTTSPTTASAPTPPRSPLPTPNTQKDVPAAGARPFWGGVAGGLGMGYTPVHTTWVPPLSLASGVGSAVLSRKGVGREQENINPHLNRAPSPPIVSPSMFVQATPAKPKPSPIQSGVQGVGAPGGFDAFADMNPFTLKTLDAYRMQLWGKMAAQGHAFQLQQQQQQQLQQLQAQQQQQQLGGLAQAMRPAFFRDASKAPSTAAATSAPAPAQGQAAPRQQEALLAAMASQTLLKKLGGAFWDAFSGAPSSSTSTPTSAGTKAWDAEKVRKVLEGRAVVRVVDVDAPVPSAKKPDVAQVVPAKKTEAAKERCCPTVAEILEESMRSLTISKK
ncbi:hypothetical protein HWV62_28728 [Athelia sp. TMB]|nr:hypothetical protein HWV62_28728 [Athelia sp. TMB]